MKKHWKIESNTLQWYCIALAIPKLVPMLSLSIWTATIWCLLT